MVESWEPRSARSQRSGSRRKQLRKLTISVVILLAGAAQASDIYIDPSTGIGNTNGKQFFMGPSTGIGSFDGHSFYINPSTGIGSFDDSAAGGDE